MKKICEIRLTTIDQIKRFPVIAEQYESDILLSHDKYIVDGTSLMGIISLNLSDKIDVNMVQKRENEAIKFVQQLKEEGYEVIE